VSTAHGKDVLTHRGSLRLPFRVALAESVLHHASDEWRETFSFYSVSSRLVHMQV